MKIREEETNSQKQYVDLVWMLIQANQLQKDSKKAIHTHKQVKKHKDCWIFGDIKELLLNFLGMIMT